MVTEDSAEHGGGAQRHREDTVAAIVEVMTRNWGAYAIAIAEHQMAEAEDDQSLDVWRTVRDRFAMQHRK